MNRVAQIRSAAIFILFVFLGYFYLSPGPLLLFQNSTTQVMSDGTDPSTLPYQYQIIIDDLNGKISNLFFGAVPTDKLNAPDNLALWIPWLEKWSVALWSKFFVVEQIQTAFVWELLVLDGFLLYLLGMAMGWGTPLSLAGGMAFAFSAYTRARAKVHMALAGIYFLPAIFLAIYLLRSKPCHRKTFFASMLFLLASMAAHYYLVLEVAFTPLFLMYFYLSPNVRTDFAKSTLRLVLAALPAVLFLAWCFLRPLPAEFISKQTSVLPPASEQLDPHGFHPFMTMFASRPMDYLAGDTAISNLDWNPLRAQITNSIHNNLDGSNPHERANGIRWLILSAFLIALISSARKPSLQNHDILFFSLFALLAFVVSLQPAWLDLPIGPSGWIHRLVPQFRVPSRAGAFVNFAVIVAAGIFVSHWAKASARRGRYLLIAPILVFAEFSPFSLAPMPTAPILPAITTSAPRLSTDCGRGLYLPYVSGTHEMLRDYYFIQQMRGSQCAIFNAMSRNDLDVEFLQRIPVNQILVDQMKSNSEDLKRRFVKYAQCSKIDWVFFDYDAPESFVADTCQRLGWEKLGRQMCATTKPQSIASKGDLMNCLKMIF